MSMRQRARKRSLAKKVSSFNMYLDQVYQVQAIMEATGATKDAPVIRELLDLPRTSCPATVRQKRFKLSRHCC